MFSLPLKCFALPLVFWSVQAILLFVRSATDQRQPISTNGNNPARVYFSRSGILFRGRGAATAVDVYF